MADRNLELALRIRTIIQGAEGVDDLRQGMNGLADEIEQAGQGAQDAGQQFDNLEDATSRAGEGANKAKKPMDELKGVLAGIITLAAAKEILALNDRLTGIRRGFETVTGSAEASDRALVFVNDTAKRLGTNALDLAQAFLKITASAKGTQLEGAPTEKIFSSIASAMSTVNASGEDLERVMDAVGQMMGKGVVSAEELRGQLGDSLPGAVQQAAQALMVSNAELSKMLESGEVVAADFLPKFAEQLEKSMGGGGKQVKSFTASWNRLVNQLVEIATGPAGQGFTAFVAMIVDKLAILTRGAGFASDTIGSLGRLLGGLAGGEFSNAFKDFGQSISDASVHLMGAKTAAEQATEQQKQMAAELAALTPALDKFQDAVARKDLKALPEYLQAAIAEFKKTGDAAAATEQAISKFMAAPAQNLSFDGLLNLATSIKAVAQDAKGAGDQIASTLGAQLAKLTNEQLVKLEEQARKAMAAAGENEAARKAFADLGQVIEGVVLARFKRLGVDGKEALTGISDAASDAIDDFTALATNAELSADAIEKAFEGALATLDSPEEIEKLKQKIIELGNSGKLTGEQVERALLLIRQRVQETANDAAFKALTDQLAKIREEADREAEASTRTITIKQAQIEATKRLAEAKGDEAAAARASADAAETEVEAARERANQITREIDLTKQHIQQLYARANADGQYSDAERDVIEVLKEKVGQLDLERQKIEANLPLQERQARQAEIMAGPIGQLTRLYAEQTKEHQRAADASEQYYSVQLKEVEGAIKVAQARGDEAEVTKLQAKQQKILIDQADTLSTAKATEAADAQKAVDAKSLELAADGELSKADKEQIANLQAVADQKKAAAEESGIYAETLKKEAEAAKVAKQAAEEQAAAAAKAKEHAEQLKAQGGFVSDTLNGWRERLDALSPAAQAAFDSVIHFAGGANQATDASHEAQKASDALGKTIASLGSTGFVEWANQLAVKAQTVEAAFWGQAAAAEQMAQRLADAIDNGSSDLGSLIRQAEATRDTLGLLDDTRLDQLQQEIDDAKAKMEALRQASEDALSAAQEALLQQQNDQVGLIELQRKQKILELEQQINAAKSAGDQESLKRLLQALAIQQQVYDLKLKDAKADADKKTTTTTAPSSNTSGGTTESGGGGRSGGNTTNITINTDIANLANEDWVRKNIIPTLSKVAGLRR